MTQALLTIDDLSVHLSPSGLETRHLTSGATGSSQHFVAVQRLAPGDRVYRHTHAVEETLVFLEGAGVATFGKDSFSISTLSSLFIPAGIPHGFANTGEEAMTVIVIFPVPYFAATVFTGEDGPGSDSEQRKAPPDAHRD